MTQESQTTQAPPVTPEARIPGATAPGPAAPAAPPVGIREAEVDGIRTVLAAGSGPVTAGLFFRVGVADETLATTGITHLVEHLALHRHGLSDLHYNGATSATYTLFHVTGTPAEVTTYLNGVCAALRDLPLERLETEREILRTESAGAAAAPTTSCRCGVTAPRGTASAATPSTAPGT